MKSAFINEKNKHLKHTSIFEYSKKLFMCSNWSFECNFVIHLLMNNSLISLAPRASSRRVCLFIILRQQLLGPAATKLTPQTATCPHFNHDLPSPSPTPTQAAEGQQQRQQVCLTTINQYLCPRAFSSSGCHTCLSASRSRCLRLTCVSTRYKYICILSQQQQQQQLRLFLIPCATAL